MQSENDSVNHPSHYTDGKYETIDFIESYDLGFHLGNAIKYLSRAGKKEGADPIQDLKKALWYMNRNKEYQEKVSSQPIHPVEYAIDKHVIPGAETIIWDLVTIGGTNFAIEKLEALIDRLEKERANENCPSGV